MDLPEVSVAMTVYNGADHLSKTVDSVLCQRGVAFEVVVVDDGSDDATAAMLAAFQERDDRLRVLRHQRNQGMTAALITACRAARGKFIARQDVGDISLPGRLETQARVLRDHPDVVLTACGTRYLSPEGWPLFESVQQEDAADAALRSTDPRRLRGPSHHGATMFRRQVYEQVGGYRGAFRVAQDLDLWTRLVEHGRFLPTARVLYEAEISPDSISGRQRARQRAMTRLIGRACALRRNGENDAPILRAAEMYRLRPGLPQLRAAQAYYFIGSCLRETRPEAASLYFRRALRSFPLHGKAWLRWLAG
jgi:glycosyltransferase involved in cell wall biosynthesis